MKYLAFETNSLSSLAEVGGKFTWENIGSTSKLIKLSDISVGRVNNASGKMAYLIPIADLGKAEEFVLTANQYGVTVEILEEADAVIKKDELMNQTT